MLLSLRKNGLTSLFKEVRVFKAHVFGDDRKAAASWDEGKKLTLSLLLDVS